MLVFIAFTSSLLPRFSASGSKCVGLARYRIVLPNDLLPPFSTIPHLSQVQSCFLAISASAPRSESQRLRHLHGSAAPPSDWAHYDRNASKATLSSAWPSSPACRFKGTVDLVFHVHEAAPPPPDPGGSGGPPAAWGPGAVFTITRRIALAG